MDTLYEVIYKRPHRARFYRGESGDLNPGDRVVMSDGPDVGKVIWKGLTAEGAEGVAVAVVKKAMPEEGDRALDLRQKEHAAFEVFKEKIAEHNLPMKPVDVFAERDGSRITFYFTSEQRVDFRQLVRDLAHLYRRRIELRQISPRIEAQMMGGCGACGRELCCACFMHVPQPVSAKIAQEQTVSQNLSKLVGVCGQLKCCLRYEQEEMLACSECNKKAEMAIELR